MILRVFKTHFNLNRKTENAFSAIKTTSKRALGPKIVRNEPIWSHSGRFPGPGPKIVRNGSIWVHSGRFPSPGPTMVRSGSIWTHSGRFPSPGLKIVRNGSIWN